MHSTPLHPREAREAHRNVSKTQFFVLSNDIKSAGQGVAIFSLKLPKIEKRFVHVSRNKKNKFPALPPCRSENHEEVK
jgi:hypothetical protein